MQASRGKDLVLCALGDKTRNLTSLFSYFKIYLFNFLERKQKEFYYFFGTSNTEIHTIPYPESFRQLDPKPLFKLRLKQILKPLRLQTLMVMVYKFWFLAADATDAIFVVFKKQKPIFFAPFDYAFVVTPDI